MFKFFKKHEKEVIPQDQFLTEVDYKKRLFKWMALFGTALLATLIALLINYFVIEKDNLGSMFATSERIIMFVIMIILLVLAISYSLLFFFSSLKVKYNDENVNRRNVVIAGFTAGFTDTISVGSFGIATAILKGTKSIKDDSKLPGTLNVGFALSGTLEAALFISAIKIDVATLVILLASILIGTFIGSALVAKIKDPKIVKISMGVILFVVGILMILTHPHVGAISTADLGDKTSLMDKAWRIIVGTILFFFLGMVQSFGVGLFAPAIAGLSFIGLEMTAILLIMSCGSALSMMPAAFNFVRRRQYMQLTASIIQVFSVFGLIAAFLIVFVGLKTALGGNMETFNNVLKWVGTAVIFYVSITMLVEYYLIVKKGNSPKVEKVEKTGKIS